MALTAKLSPLLPTRRGVPDVCVATMWLDAAAAAVGEMPGLDIAADEDAAGVGEALEDNGMRADRTAARS